MTDYQIFLEKIRVISEESFNDIINSLPKFDIDSIEFELYDEDDENEIAGCFINSIIEDIDYDICADDIDFKNKSFELYDVPNLETLVEISNKFSKWTISNYNEIVEEIENKKEEEEKNKESKEKNTIINRVISKVPLYELAKLLEKYDN